MRGKRNIVLPAEWYPQSGVQLTWPHGNTDWAPVLDEAVSCFVAIAREIMKRERLLIVCDDEKEVRARLGEFNEEKVIFRVFERTNDTWARDHGGITVLINGAPVVYDFLFNGWGMKFPANRDNLITGFLARSGVFSGEVPLRNMKHFVLEGGSIESDGAGTILTTRECFQSLNRNVHLSLEQIESSLKDMFGADRILWLENGSLTGDDTDGHIDTLARFCNEETIAYVKCQDTGDMHYEELLLMEEELKTFTRKNGEPYRLIPLPMADKVEWEEERLPATYANFLIINGAVLLPFYNSPKDEIAKAVLQVAFPDREIIGIDCSTLIKQHGSLHCVTMQYPVRVLNVRRFGNN
ncbi:MAG: agmatine deiminase family protein [Tannerellaceae bacterium]|jgi:agmatine/peptidylarginine deiminase|nr:agmatine deiminase family protein [Tannerellaceae bacterium]